MKYPLIATILLTVLPAGAALAGDDCHVPRDAWQPPEAVMQAAAGLGWRVDEIEADDGCWEVEGLDAQGRRIEAKLDPRTLEIVELRQRDPARKRGERHAPAAIPATPTANPPSQSGAVPVVPAN